MRNWFLLALIAVMLLGFGLRVRHSGTLGLQTDEGLHITVAERIAAGDVVYRDLFENRTPLVEWLLAGLFRLGGTHWFWGRWPAALAAMVTMAALAAAARLAGRHGRFAALIAVSLFAITPLAVFWSRYGMLEHVQTAVSTLSITLALMALQRNNKENGRLWFWAGLLAGLAFLAKQTAVVMWPAVVLAIVWKKRRVASGEWRVGRVLLWWVVGLLVPLGVFALILWQQGALSDFLTFLSGADRLAPFVGWQEKGTAVFAWARRQPLLVPALVGVAALRRRRTPAFVLIVLWAGAETAALLLPPQVDLGWGGFSHYVITAVAAVSLMAGVGSGECGLRIADYRLRIADYRLRIIVLVVLGVGTAVTLPGWWADMNFVLRDVDYPQATMAAEQAVGLAVRGVTQPDDAMLVFGNAGFYYWAGRKPAARFFHFPTYLLDSPLLLPVEADLQQALSPGNAGAVLASRMHLEERLTEPITAVLWQHWVPVQLFSYPYQRDMFLFLPKTAAPTGEPAAVFVGEIGLTAVSGQVVDDQHLLVRLDWVAETAVAADYVAFVHLLRPDGSLLSQHDGVPVVGYRPTTSWQPNEPIVDWHWVEIPAGTVPDEITVSVGLYDPAAGDRLPLQSPTTEVNSFTISWHDLLTTPTNPTE